MYTITPIPAFNDNYIWCIAHQNQAVVVDPGCANATEAYLSKHGLNLHGILVTHHHQDHTGGIKQLKQKYSCTVHGYKHSHIDDLTDFYVEGDQLALFNDQWRLKVLEVPGHTLDHIAFYDKQHLFCGDTVFSAGCGRLFEGSAGQMLESIKKIAALPDSYQLFPTHEYTLANLNFAEAVEPDNSAIQQTIQDCQQLREQNLPTLPTTLSKEKQINPFLRCHLDSVKQSVAQKFQLQNPSELQTFAQVRRWKDDF